MPIEAEIKRLAELHALAILDSEPEESFDRITSFTRDLFSVPVALITLIDQDRQWVKSCSGMNVPELPRKISFCTYAIQSDDIMLVPDMHMDPKFIDHPLVIGEPFVRFYAGAPLITPEGNRIGTLCIVDTKPHMDFDAGKQKRLGDLAQMAIEQIMLKGVMKQIIKTTEGKSNFLTHLNHELRTPLNAVIGGIQLFERLGALNERQERVMQTVRIASDNMLSLINDHLDFSRLENGHLTVRQEPIHYDAMLNDIHALLSYQAENKNLQFDLDLAHVKGKQGQGDTNRIRQILVNLVGNSIKFTQKGSVNVKAKIEKEADKEIFVCDIVDTGIGIPADAIDKIFNIYERAVDKQDAVIKGTGLGLAISKRLAEMMGGAISVTSTEGEGSVFTLRVPC